METSLWKMQSNLSDLGILISFSGRFSQGIIEELGEAIKKYMEAEDRPKNDIYNVFAIFIEQTQNIKNYSLTKAGSEGYDRIVNSGIVSIGKTREGYYIWSGNLLENKDVKLLSEKLDIVRTQDKDTLKKMYKEQLKKELPPDSIGAGVGLIEMARKASKPLEYAIQQLDENFSFYELRVIV